MYYCTTGVISAAASGQYQPSASTYRQRWLISLSFTPVWCKVIAESSLWVRPHPDVLLHQAMHHIWVEGQIMVTKVVANGVLRTEYVHQKIRHFGSLLNILVRNIWSILKNFVNIWTILYPENSKESNMAAAKMGKIWGEFIRWSSIYAISMQWTQFLVSASSVPARVVVKNSEQKARGKVTNWR